VAPISNLKIEKTWGKADEVCAFLQDQTRKNAGFSIDDEYPSLLQGDVHAVSFVARSDEKKIISHTGTVLSEFQWGDKTFPFGMIGSVVTEPLSQGKGIASKLIEEAVLELRKQGALFAVLWSDQDGFYNRMGFYRGGLEKIILIDRKKILPVPRKVKCTSYDPQKHFSSIYQIYQNQKNKVQRSEVLFRRLLAIPKAKTFVLEESGCAKAYAIIGKGWDFANTIHEWGGDPHDILEMIITIQQEHYRMENLAFVSPVDQETDLLEQYSSAATIGALGFFKVLDRKKIIDGFSEYFPDEKKRSQSDPLLIDGLFGKEGLPFFIWGLDSI
jgi:GNAT superfamily N-acetyltransferase